MSSPSAGEGAESSSFTRLGWQRSERKGWHAPRPVQVLVLVGPLTLHQSCRGGSSQDSAEVTIYKHRDSYFHDAQTTLIHPWAAPVSLLELSRDSHASCSVAASTAQLALDLISQSWPHPDLRAWPQASSLICQFIKLLEGQGWILGEPYSSPAVLQHFVSGPLYTLKNY